MLFVSLLQCNVPIYLYNEQIRYKYLSFYHFFLILYYP